MRLRRFEFGIASSDSEIVTVYARRRDGTLFLRSYPAGLRDVLTHAQREFEASRDGWEVRPGVPNSTGLSLVGSEPCKVLVSGEAAITAEALGLAEVEVIVSVSNLAPETREEIRRFLRINGRARHVDAPILDVVARHQTPLSSGNAERAIGEARSAIKARRTLLVHCLMGVHRSVSVTAVAMTQAGVTPTARDAFLQIQSHRHLASWIPESVAWLESLPRITLGGE